MNEREGKREWGSKRHRSTPKLEEKIGGREKFARSDEIRLKGQRRIKTRAQTLKTYCQQHPHNNNNQKARKKEGQY